MFQKSTPVHHDFAPGVLPGEAALPHWEPVDLTAVDTPARHAIQRGHAYPQFYAGVAGH